MTIETEDDGRHFLAWLASLPDNTTFGAATGDDSSGNNAEEDDNDGSDDEEDVQQDNGEAAEEDDWVYPVNKKHQAYLRKCMMFLDERYYTKDHQFTKQQEAPTSIQKKVQGGARP
jgi:hypothetical protein